MYTTNTIPFTKICEKPDCKQLIYWDRFLRRFINEDKTIHSCGYKPGEQLQPQRRSIYEEIREFKQIIDERLADSQLENNRQLEATQKAIAAVRAELFELNNNLKHIMKSVRTV